MKCSYHCCNKTIKTGHRFCGVNCKRKYFVDKRRKDIRQMALNYKGDVCQVCGYNKCESALVFHHIKSNEKDFGLSAKGYTRSWVKVKKELDKCLLVCSNCHAEIHSRQLSVVRRIVKSGEFGERGVPPTPSQVSMGKGIEKGVETRR